MTSVQAGHVRLAPDIKTISCFLRETLREDIHLAWIIPDGGRTACGGRWFGTNVEEAVAWAALHNTNGRNVYWTVNVVQSGLHKKPKKTDIQYARFVHVDIDPPKDGTPFDRAAVQAQLGLVDPTFVIDSGGGLQAFWRLDQTCEDLAVVERLNVGVRDLFAADACQNIDRLMRIPGTINWPDKRKQARGRVPALARIVVNDTGETHEADHLKTRFVAASACTADSTSSDTAALNKLGITALCQPLHRLLTMTDPNRRSEEVLHAAGEMIRRGYEEATIVRTLLEPTLEISGHCLDQPDPQRAAARAVAKARSQERRACASHQDGQGVKLEDFYAYMPGHSYIFAPTGEHWPGASVNSRLPSMPMLDKNGLPVVDEKGKPKQLNASQWLDQLRPVEQMTWAPGEPQIVRNRLISDGGWMEREGCNVFNLYRPPVKLSGDAELAGPWLDHIRVVYPDDAEHIVYWLAHRVQRPHEKLNHALVLGGAQGIGKDTILEPVKAAIGPWNFAEVSPQHMLGRFNGFVKSVILRVSEARDLGEVDRFSFYDHMKTYTAAPPDVLRIDEKHVREYAVFNVCGVIITTNHKTDGIFLPADDRRHYVAWSEYTRDRFSAGYWSKLYGWYASGGAGHVAAYLSELSLDRFDPKAPPPKTAAFWDIVASNQAPEDAELADAIEKLGAPHALTLGELAAVADLEFSAWLRERRNSRKIPHRMEECGYVAVRNDGAKDGLFKVLGKRCAVYAHKSLSRHDALLAAKDLSEGKFHR